MKQKIADFIDLLNNDKLKVLSNTTDMEAMVESPATLMQPLYEFVKEQIKKDQLGVGELVIADSDTVIRVETNVINLPLQEVGRISKMISDEEVMGVNVYLLVISPKVNVSGLRIDEIANAEEFSSKLDDYLSEMNAWVDDKILAITTNLSDGEVTEGEEDL